MVRGRWEGEGATLPRVEGRKGDVGGGPMRREEGGAPLGRVEGGAPLRRGEGGAPVLLSYRMLGEGEQAR